jgi:outer membrane lipoprotein SlyB
MSRPLFVFLIIVVGSLVYLTDAFAQRAGQSTTVRTGTVTESQSVDLSDGNAIKGALVGGAVGSVLTRSKKGSSRRDRNAAIGAVVGASRQASKTKPGRLYTVTTNEGTMVQVATEQTEIRIDECVFVEEAGGTANIRRAPDTACAPETQALLLEADMIEELQEEANECAASKQELVDATSDEAVDRAIRKVQLLCYD